MYRPTPSPTLFPYTTLFRSHDLEHVPRHRRLGRRRARDAAERGGAGDGRTQRTGVEGTALPGPLESGRSEEHTSELQSRPHLVCRLLLEKKNGGMNKTT